MGERQHIYFTRRGKKHEKMLNIITREMEMNYPVHPLNNAQQKQRLEPGCRHIR